MKKTLVLFLTILVGLCFIGCNDDNKTSNIRISNYTLAPGPTEGSISIQISALEANAMIYYILTLDKASDASASQIIDGVDFDGNEVIKSGSSRRVLGILIDGLLERQIYKLHFVLEFDGKISEPFIRTVLTKDKVEAGAYGDGSQEAPFQISSAAQLAQVAGGAYGYTESAYYRLMNDIDLADEGFGVDKPFVPLGKQEGQNKKFSGVFDGAGHTISNLYINQTPASADNQGLFAETTIDSRIDNLTLRNATIIAIGSRIGALIGDSRGTVTNVSVLDSTITHISGEGQVGGILGRIYASGSLTNAYSNAIVIAGNRRAGGIVGTATTTAGNTPITISNVHFSGSVKAVAGDARQVGGIIGAMTDINLFNAVCTGIVEGTRQIGGVVGFIEGRDSSMITILDNVVYLGTQIKATNEIASQQTRLGKVIGERATGNPHYIIGENLYAVDNEVLVYNEPPTARITIEHQEISEIMLKTIEFYQLNLQASFLSAFLVVEGQYPILRRALV